MLRNTISKALAFGAAVAVVGGGALLMAAPAFRGRRHADPQSCDGVNRLHSLLRNLRRV